MFKRFRYPISFWLKLLPAKSMLFQIENDRFNFNNLAFNISICNGQFFGGGWNISPKSSLQDGLLNIQIFISQNVELSSENGGFNKILKGKVIRISPQVKQRQVLSTDPTGDADARIIEVLVKLNEESIKLVKNYTGMKVIARFLP